MEDFDRQLSELASTLRGDAPPPPTTTTTVTTTTTTAEPDLMQQLSDLREANHARALDAKVSDAGICASCGAAIISGSALVASDGRCYHPEHFLCCTCKKPLSTEEHFSLEGKAFCAECWARRSDRCDGCGQPITAGDFMTAGTRRFHFPRCFTCAECGAQLGDTFVARESDGRPMCEKHRAEKVCAGCNAPITGGEYLMALGKPWHANHLVCEVCRKPLSGQQFFDAGGRPHCAGCYNARTGAICGGCGKAISGRAVSALGKAWHEACWACAMCRKPLQEQPFMEKNGKPYCAGCFRSLFA